MAAAGEGNTTGAARNDAAGTPSLAGRQPGLDQPNAANLSARDTADHSHSTTLGTEHAEPSTTAQDTITGPTSADVMPAPELSSPDQAAATE